MFLPQGGVHTFRNAGVTVGRIAASFFPAGFETFFGKFAEKLEIGIVPDSLAAAVEGVGVTFFLNPLVSLCH